MQRTEKALVLRVGRFREIDLWVRLYSAERGPYTAFAFGGAKSRRRFCGCLDVFNHLLVTVTPSRDGQFLNMDEATLLSGFSGIKNDWNRIGLAVNCLKFAEAVTGGPDSAGAIHDLLLDTLHVIETAPSPDMQLAQYFRARVTLEQGFALDTGACHCCGGALHRGAAASLSVSDGALVCTCCAGQKRGMLCLPLPGGGVDAMRVLPQVQPEEWCTLDVASGDKAQCLAAMDVFIEHHLGISWENGRYVRS